MNCLLLNINNKLIRMKLSFLYAFLLLLPFKILAQKTLAEKLGYSKNDKLLIVHADDLGLSHSEDHASFAALEMGMITSGSVIVPAPWFLEVAEYKKLRPNADIGIHFTLTSEWINYKWRPVTDAPSITDFSGYFFDNCADMENNAKYKEVEKELRAQIDVAIINGIYPTHLDIHMGCLVYSELNYFKLYLKLGREYKIPVMVTTGGLSKEYKSAISEDDIVIDNVYSAGAQHFDQVGGLAERYRDILKNLKPGVSALVLHAAYDSKEMQQITISKKYWGAKWRQDDFNFFTSEEYKQLLEKQNIKLISWKEIGDKLIKK